MVNRVRIPDCAFTRVQWLPHPLVTAARYGIAHLSLLKRGVQRATPDAGGTTFNLTVVGSNPIRRTSGGSSVVEQQECLVTVRRCFIEGPHRIRR